MNFESPVAKQVPFTRTHHGDVFEDPYEWLRDKESADTIAYLEAENAYTKQETANLSTLEENIYQEVKSRVKETDMSIPVRRGDYWYYGRTVEGQNYAIMCRIPVDPEGDKWRAPKLPEQGAPEGEQVILDHNELAEGHEFFSVGASALSDNGRYLAYSVDITGDERYDLRIKDLETGELMPEVIEGVFYGATWAGNSHVFYTRVDAAWRPESIWRHKLGTDPSEDVRVFAEADEKFNVGIGSFRSDKYLLLCSGSRTTTECWVLPTDTPEGEFECLIPREQDVDYGVDHAVVDGQEYWVFVHNAFGPNSSVGYAPVNQEQPYDLRTMPELIAHREDVRIEAVDPYRDFLVLAYREGGIPRVAVMDVRQGWSEFKPVEFDEELYSAGCSGHPEFDTPVIRIGYSSFTTPSRKYDYWVESGELELLKEQEIPGGYNREEYVARREWAEAADGTLIPISIVHRADLDTTQPNPAVLYGYGSYEASMDPGFSVSRLSLMDRGMMWVVAHVRGGGEMGRAWYDNGKMLTKKHTFTDFITVADHLIAKGLTTPDQLVAMGGSAGGLLVGAVANMGGDRFKAIEASVPFVDNLTSILMPELPLTIGEWEEWGDPLHDPEVYQYIKSYSPYENIQAKAYPNILATTSLNDTRVLYVEPAKWIAKLRATATGGQFLLKTEMAAGHGGVSGRYAAWRQLAFEYAWVINQATGKLA